MAEKKSRSQSRRNRFINRRQLLAAAGATIGASVIASYGTAQSEEPIQMVTPTPNATETTTEPTVEPAEEGGPPNVDKDLEIFVPRPTLVGETPGREPYSDFITPVEKFFVRNHHPVPDIDASEWTISLTGLSGQEDVELSMEEIKHSYPTETKVVTIECSGNSGGLFPESTLTGLGFGLLSTTPFTGTPVSAVLEDHNVDTSEGRWLAAIGADGPEETYFTRSLPMEKITKDCLLAYEMAGQPLPSDHGYPIRLLVPGWYGVNSVKWLERMHVMDTMVFGDEWEQYTQWQQFAYRFLKQGEEVQEEEEIGVYTLQDQLAAEEIENPFCYERNVKSIIGYPTGGEVSPSPGGTIEVIGVAWAGDNDVKKVDVSTDGGQSWGEAEFFGPVEQPEAWRLFRFVWEDPEPGDHLVVSRATDEEDRAQPAIVSDPGERLDRITDQKFPWNQGGYWNNAYKPHGVEVTVSRG